MKHMLNIEQSNYLVKLGCPSPKNTVNYTLGELMKMLPKTLTVKDEVYYLHISSNEDDWYIDYHNICEVLCMTFHPELVDALFNMIDRLHKTKYLNENFLR